MSLNVTSKFVKVWDIEKTKNGFAKVNLGTSKKDKDGNYSNSNWWGVLFFGNAKEFGLGLKQGDVINIDSAILENVYNKEKKVTYFNMVVFEASYVENNKPVKNGTPVQSGSDDDFPFIY